MRFLKARIAAWTEIEREKDRASANPGEGQEIQLFEIVRSLAVIFTTGALRPALVQAQRCRDFLARTQKLHLKDQRWVPGNI